MKDSPLKTTNPILHAYRYVRADTPYRLGLKITRHRELAVQDATIEQARYHTLVTRDGVRVTTVNYTIRNSRKQFLRLQLPIFSVRRKRLWHWLQAVSITSPS